MITILKAGDSIAEVKARLGDYDAWIKRAARYDGSWRVVDVRTDAPLPPIDGPIIVTGSASSVTERAPWMLRLEEHLRRVVEAKVPFFGICFGHQILAQALGGEVARNPRGREIGTVRCQVLEDDPIFEARSFDVNMTHSDTVVRLPPGARVLARTDKDDIAAYAIGDRIRCVQFHPEIDGEAMRGYVMARTPLITAEGMDAAAILAQVNDALLGAATLRAFVRQVTREVQ